MSLTEVPADWSGTTSETVYEYLFSAFPMAQHPRNTKAVFVLFQNLTTMIVEEMTEREFNDFREELAKAGYELHEITRKPKLSEQLIL